MEGSRPSRAPVLLAVAYTGMLGASVAIVSRRPDLETRVGRHLWAGALAVVALVVVEVLICLFPLRRGETWARWAAFVPFAILSVPIFIIDALYVSRQNLLATLLPQGIGLFVGILVLFRIVLRSRVRRPRHEALNSRGDR